MVKGSQPVISPKNLPPSFRWIYFIWFSLLTVKVYDLDVGWYYALGVFALFQTLGLIAQIYQAKYLDIFSSMKGPK